MKTVALVSPDSSGHHQTYLRRYALTLLQLGHAVAAFTPAADDLVAWIGRACPDRADRLRAAALHYVQRWRAPGPFAIFFGKAAWVRFIAKTVAATGIRPDLVFHTWLDNCLTPGLTAGLTDLLFPYPWSGLYFHPWYLRQKLPYAWLRRGPLSNHDALRSPRCPAVALLDEGVAGRLQSLLGKKPVLVFPDIADDSPPDPAFEPAHEIIERGGTRKVVGLLGVLSRRKGMLTLIEMAQRAAKESWFFVFAGALDQNSFSAAERQAIAEFVRSKPANCFFYLQRIPDEPQFNALVNACDVLFAVYRDFLTSSNLLTKAAIFRKPIMVSDRHCMGERVVAFGLGATAAEQSVEQCLDALYCLGDRLDQTGGLATARFEDYRRLHSVERLHAAFGELLAAAGL